MDASSASAPRRPAGERRVHRWVLLREIDRLTDTPLLLLAFVWLGLLVVELSAGLSPPLEILTYVIWAFFIADFAIELVIAPDRRRYLRTHWLTAVSLVLPAARVLRVVRIVRLSAVMRALRSLSLLRIVTSINRGLGALGATLARRGLGYVLAATVVVALVGAAGMLTFEPGLRDYGDALWWTLMVISTLGSGFWPESPEGRILTLMLALYGFAIFGYVTAALATHFLGRERAIDPTEASLRAELARLRQEVAALRGSIPTRG